MSCVVLIVTACGHAGSSATSLSSPSHSPADPEEIAAIAQRFLDASRGTATAPSPSTATGYPEPAANDITELGLADPAEAARATIGTPVERFMLSPDAITRYRPGQRVSALLTPTNDWWVPVLVNGDGRTSIFVSYRMDRWQYVGHSGNFTDPVVRLQHTLADPTATIKQVTIPHGGGIYLALVEQDGQESLVLLHPVRGLDDKQLLERYAPDEIMPLLADLATSDR